MRFGIYLGRQAGNTEGIAVYCRALSEELLRGLAEERTEDTELVIYGDASIIDEKLKTEIEISSVLSAFSDRLFDLGANKYFRKLPSGVKCQVLLRTLPGLWPRRLWFFLDQLLLPLWLYLDRVQGLHSTSNTAILLAPCPQVVSVHDLFQAWPPNLEQNVESLNQDTPSSLVGIYQRVALVFYRVFYWLQFRRLERVVTATPSVGKEIYRRYGFDEARISTIELGLDRVFLDFLAEDRSLREKLVAGWLAERKLEPGYVLLFASLNPRKNLQRNLLAWLEAGQDTNLLIRARGRAERQAVQSFLPEEDLERVIFLEPLVREELPYLYSGAAVLLAATLGEAYGLPAIEALSLECLLVSSELESLADYRASKRIFFCNPRDEKSIRDSLAQALERAEEAVSGSEQADWPSMTSTARETFAQYKAVILRAGQLA